MAVAISVRPYSRVRFSRSVPERGPEMSGAEVKKVIRRTEDQGRSQKADIRLFCTEKDIYTLEEVAHILHIGKQLAYALVKLKDDPLPVRQLKYKTRGYLVTRQELNEWIERNAPLMHGESN